MERSKAGTNNRSPDGLSHPNQNTIIINKIRKYFIRNGKSTMKLNWQKTKWTGEKNEMKKKLIFKKWQIIHPPPGIFNLSEKK